MRNRKAILKGYVSKILVFLDFLLWTVCDLSKFKRIKPLEIKRAVIIHRGGIGELMMITPVIKLLKEKTNAHITLKINNALEGVFTHNPNVDQIIQYEPGFKKNLAQFRKEKYDLAMILWPGSLFLSFAALRAGIKYRVGCFKMVRDGPAFFYTRRWFPLKTQHAIQSNMDMIRLLGFDEKNPQLEFYFSKQEERKVRSYLSKRKIKKYAILHPGFGSLKDRSWKLENYAKVADRITKTHKIPILITGTKNEQEAAEKIYSLAKNKKQIHITNGEFNLSEFGCLIANSEILIAPDTGAVHIASAFDTKIVDLVGRSDPTVWRPWTKKENYKVLYHPGEYTIHEREYSEKIGLECISRITEDEVGNAVDELLKAKVKKKKEQSSK